MGLLFFIAGTLSSPAVRRKGPGRFALDRAIRLGIPLAFYVVAIEPLNDYIGDLPEGAGPLQDYYVNWWTTGEVAVGVMWFVAILLVFSIGLAAFRLLRPGPAPQPRPPLARELGLAVAVVFVASFLVRLVWPFGSDTPLDLNLWESPQMLALFVLGTSAGDHRWFVDGLPDDVWHRCAALAVCGVAVLLVAGAIFISGDMDAFLGGVQAQAVAFPLAEGLISVGASVWIAELFRRRWNRGGPLSRHLGRASFGAYVAHTPVIVTLAIALGTLDVPVEVKLVLVIIGGLAGSFGLGWLATRWRPLARIL